MVVADAAQPDVPSSSYLARFLFSCTGQLNTPKFPPKLAAQGLDADKPSTLADAEHELRLASA